MNRNSESVTVDGRRKMKKGGKGKAKGKLSRNRLERRCAFGI